MDTWILSKMLNEAGSYFSLAQNKVNLDLPWKFLEKHGLITIMNVPLDPISNDPIAFFAKRTLLGELINKELRENNPTPGAAKYPEDYDPPTLKYQEIACIQNLDHIQESMQ